MGSQIVEAIYQDGVLKPLQALELPENAHVRIQVVPLSEEEALTGENRFKAQLLELGLLREVKSPLGLPEGDRTPVQVQGKPLSQLIIEERR